MRYVLITLWWILSQGFPGGASGKESACQWRRCQRLWFNPERPGLDSCIGNSHRIPILVTRSSSLAWKIPWTEESEGLQSMASQCQTWLRRHASYRHKYWANFFMSPYTPDLKHNSSTRSKNFQNLPLSLGFVFFFFLLWLKHRWDPNRDLIASNIRMVQWSRSVDWRLVGPISSALKLEWPASYQQSCLSKLTISKIAVVATYWSS